MITKCEMCLEEGKEVFERKVFRGKRVYELGCLIYICGSCAKKIDDSESPWQLYKSSRLFHATNPINKTNLALF